MCITLDVIFLQHGHWHTWPYQAATVATESSLQQRNGKICGDSDEVSHVRYIQKTLFSFLSFRFALCSLFRFCFTTSTARGVLLRAKHGND